MATIMMTSSLVWLTQVGDADLIHPTTGAPSPVLSSPQPMLSSVHVSARALRASPAPLARPLLEAESARRRREQTAQPCVRRVLVEALVPVGLFRERGQIDRG